MYKKIFNIIVLLITFLLVISNFITSVHAHPGSYIEGTKCHVCRKNCEDWGYNYNEQHCHYDSIPKENLSSGVPKENQTKEIARPEKKTVNFVVYLAIYLGLFAFSIIILIIALPKENKKNK